MAYDSFSINIEFFWESSYQQLFAFIHNSIHNPPYHPQKMWTECRTHSTFNVEMIAENLIPCMYYEPAININAPCEIELEERLEE